MSRGMYVGWILLLAAGLLPAVPSRPRVLFMKATAYFRAPEPTRAGNRAREGIVAADPRVLPLGTRIRVRGAGRYDGVYLVTDTGRDVCGREIDIYIPNAGRSRRFGEKRVRVTILSIGHGPKQARREAREDLIHH